MVVLKACTDNRIVLTSETFVNWATTHNVFIDFMQPDCPYQNTYIERYNRTYSDEVLDCYLLQNLNKVKQITHDWMQLYPNHRPRDSLNDMTPVEYRNTA